MQIRPALQFRKQTKNTGKHLHLNYQALPHSYSKNAFFNCVTGVNFVSLFFDHHEHFGVDMILSGIVKKFKF